MAAWWGGAIYWMATIIAGLIVACGASGSNYPAKAQVSQTARLLLSASAAWAMDSRVTRRGPMLSDDGANTALLMHGRTRWQ